MIEEMLDFYFENRISATQTNFVTRTELEEKLQHKLEREVYNDYVKRQIIENNRERFQLEAKDRLHALERAQMYFVTKEAHQSEIEQRVSNSYFKEFVTEMAEYKTMTELKERNIVESAKLNQEKG